MAAIIGGVATSHTPTIGFAYDQGKQDDPDWAPIFRAFAPVSNWFKEQQPDAIVYIFNDHVTSFFFDHYSAFTLGIGEEFPVADEGGGGRVERPGHVDRVAQEPLARLGQLSARAAPLDQLVAGQPFQLGQRLGDGRLAEVEPLGRPRERPLLGDDHETAEVPEANTGQRG